MTFVELAHQLNADATSRRSRTGSQLKSTRPVAHVHRRSSRELPARLLGTR